MSKSRFYFFRHGESVLNTQRQWIGGRSNETPLTPRGQEQASRLGRFLVREAIAPSHIYASPAVRTLDTARLALQEMGIYTPPPTDPRLQEMDQGAWTGLLRAQIYTAEVYAAIARQGMDFKAPGGESMHDVGSRMREWFDETTVGLPNTHDDQTVFVFGHGVAIRCLMADLYGWTHAQTYQTEIDNTSMTCIADTGSDWELEYVGRMPANQ